MTHSGLHQIKDFRVLRTDERFVGLMSYLATLRPRATQREAHGMIQDSGKLDAYMDILDKLEGAFRAPAFESEVPRPPGPYQSAPPLEQKA